MRRHLPALALSLFITAPPLFPGDAAPTPKRFTAPVPPEVWTLRDDPSTKAAGALVLEDRWRLGLEDGAMERVLRVRIVNASGLSAGALDKTLDTLVALEGRISYPDGTSLALDTATDLHEKSWFRKEGFWWTQDLKRSILEIPGLTPDCLVELDLKLKPYPGSEMEAIEFQHPFPTREMTVELRGGWHESICFRPDPAFKPEQTREEGAFFTTFRNLPAYEEPPFGAGFLSRASRLYIYLPQQGVPPRDARDTTGFWQDVATEILKENYDFLPLNRHHQSPDGEGLMDVPESKSRRSYDDLLRAVARDLPAAPQARALELHARLGQKVRLLPYGSLGWVNWVRSKAVPNIWDSPGDLEYPIDQGVGSDKAWFSLYFNLLRDLGVHPDLIWAGSAQDLQFLPNLRTVGQFHHKLLRVTEEGRPVLFLDPLRRDGHPDQIPGECQGLEAFAVETRTWKPATLRLPWQKCEEAVTELAWRLEPGPATTGFEVRAAFQGRAESLERRAFEDEDGDSRKASVVRRLEHGNLDLRVDAATASDPKEKGVPFTWSASGRLVPEGELSVLPFPAHLGLPDLEGPLPMDRKEAIYLGPPRIQRWSSTVKLPAGCRWTEEAPLEASFPFGTLRRTAALGQDGATVEVHLEVRTLEGVAPASDYGAFRRYLSLLRKAVDTPIFLERQP